MLARQCRTKTVEKPGDTGTPRELVSVKEAPTYLLAECSEYRGESSLVFLTDPSLFISL